jgi:hypothetical protein
MNFAPTLSRVFWTTLILIAFLVVHFMGTFVRANTVKNNSTSFLKNGSQVAFFAVHAAALFKLYSQFVAHVALLSFSDISLLSCSAESVAFSEMRGKEEKARL